MFVVGRDFATRPLEWLYAPNSTIDGGGGWVADGPAVRLPASA